MNIKLNGTTIDKPSIIDKSILLSSRRRKKKKIDRHSFRRLFTTSVKAQSRSKRREEGGWTRIYPRLTGEINCFHGTRATIRFAYERRCRFTLDNYVRPSRYPLDFQWRRATRRSAKGAWFLLLKIVILRGECPLLFVTQSFRYRKRFWISFTLKLIDERITLIIKKSFITHYVSHFIYESIYLDLKKYSTYILINSVLKHNIRRRIICQIPNQRVTK